MSDWSSDVCSSDLEAPSRAGRRAFRMPSVHSSCRRGPGQVGRAGRAEKHKACCNGRAKSHFSPLFHVLRSEEHTYELQSLMRISYAVFCLKKKKNKNTYTIQNT